MSLNQASIQKDFNENPVLFSSAGPGVACSWPGFFSHTVTNLTITVYRCSPVTGSNPHVRMSHENQHGHMSHCHGRAVCVVARIVIKLVTAGAHYIVLESTSQTSQAHGSSMRRWFSVPCMRDSEMCSLHTLTAVRQCCTGIADRACGVVETCGRLCQDLDCALSRSQMVKAVGLNPQGPDKVSRVNHKHVQQRTAT